MAFVYSTSIQDRIALTVFGVANTSLSATQKTHLDGAWTSGAVTTGAAFDAITRVEQIANWFEMAGATSAPQAWEHWVVWECCALLAKTYRPERAAQYDQEREKAIDAALDSFTIVSPTGAFSSSNSSQAITVQGIRYFVLNHCARRKEAGKETGMRRRIFPPIDMIDSYLQSVLNTVYNKEHWSFRKRDVLMTIKFLSTVTAATWTESTKTLTQTGAFTNLLLTNGPAMLLVTSGTGAFVGEYQVATKVSADAITLTTSLSTTNTNLATGDIVASLFYLDFRGLLSGETIDAVASRRFYYQNGTNTVGPGRRLNWVDSTAMSNAKACNSITTGQPSMFRFETQPLGVRSWRLAPFPNGDYTLNGAVYVSGPGTPSSVSDTTVFDKFPVEFGTVIRDMVLAEVLRANNASDAGTFLAKAEDNMRVLLPSFVDQGSPTRLQSAEDCYQTEQQLMGNGPLGYWGGPFTGGLN